MSTIEERQQNLLDEFSEMNNWEERYKKIIDKGKTLTKLADEIYDDKFLVKGCQSRVWLHAQLEDSRMVLQADSDALIVKGLVALLLDLYSGAQPQEVLKHSPSFIEELGFQSYLSPSRANGFLSMIKQIKLYAQAFELQKQL